MSHDKADEVIKKRFKSPFSRYQIWLGKSMKDSNFIFDCVVCCIANSIK